MKRYSSLFFFLTFSVFCTPSFSVQIVSIQAEYGGATHTLDLELFDDIVGPSVTNFLNYVNDDGVNGFRFNDTFITRSVPGQFLQTGSFTFRPTDPATDNLKSITDPGSALATVPTDPAIVNDFNLSNIRGTIAYARTAVVDSATSGWFINLDDNSANLDNQNEGFTVFGRVIDDGMVIADEMASFPIHPFANLALGPDFAKLPVVNYDTTASPLPVILRSNLIMLANFSPIIRPIIRLEPSVDFQLDIAGDSIESSFITTLKNTGNESLVVGSIANLSAPFNISNDGCSNTTLLPQSEDAASTCSIEIGFSAIAEVVSDDVLTIPYTNILNTSNYTVSYPVTGEGAPFEPNSSVSASTITFSTALNSSSDEIVNIKNIGGGALAITSINLAGIDSDQFNLDTSSCTAALNSLNINESCDVIVSFTPLTEGLKNASLEIQTSANDTSVTLNAFASNPVLTAPSTLEIVASVNQTVSELFTATNTGNGNLIFDSITLSGADAGFFTIQDDDCFLVNNTGVLLGINQSCDISVAFNPTDTTTRTATLTLSSNAADTPVYAINLTGSVGDPIISAPTSVDVGISQIDGTTAVKELQISNTGPAPLDILSISGLAGTDYFQINNCVGTENQVAQNNTCTVQLRLTSTTAGASAATLTISSNDPVNPAINISISGFGDFDTDGIAGSIELAAPNAGDNNNDSTTDDTQNNVATLTGLNSNYITFVAESFAFIQGTKVIRPDTRLLDVKLITTIPANKPETATFDYGLFSYSIELLVGEYVDLGIFLPANEKPTSFYKFGPTANNTTPHWYDFSYDAATGTGARFLGSRSIQSETDTTSTVQRNLVVVHYIDGARGDDDLQANGTVLNSTSGISFTKQTNSGSGSLTYLPIFILLMIRVWRNRRFQKNISYFFEG